MNAHQQLWRTVQNWFQRRTRSAPRPSRLAVERLEDRCVATASPANPASGFFFNDGNNQLWLFNAQTAQYTNTGGYAKEFSGGVDAQGNPEVFFTDGNNQLWSWDNGAFTNTGAFALELSAGRGMVAFADGNYQLYTLTDGVGFFNTGHSVQNVFPGGSIPPLFSTGWDASGNNLVAFVDPGNQLWTLTPGPNTLANTGGFGGSIGVGRDGQGFNQVYFLDGLGQLYRFDQGHFLATGHFPTDPSGSLLGSKGKVYLADQDNNVVVIDDQLGPTTTNAVFDQLSASPGTNVAYVTAIDNQIFLFQNGQFVSTPAFGHKISAY